MAQGGGGRVCISDDLCVWNGDLVFFFEVVSPVGFVENSFFLFFVFIFSRNARLPFLFINKIIEHSPSTKGDIFSVQR
jgi:hypothetical protein